MLHALWVDWYDTRLRNESLTVLAGGSDEVHADAHAAFDDRFDSTQPPPRQEPEDRLRIIAALSAG